MQASIIRDFLQAHPLPEEELNRFSDIDPSKGWGGNIFCRIRNTIIKRIERGDTTHVSREELQNRAGGLLGEVLLQKQLQHIRNIAKAHLPEFFSGYVLAEAQLTKNLGACNLVVKDGGNAEFRRRGKHHGDPLREFDALMFSRSKAPLHLLLFDSTSSPQILREKCSSENVQQFHDFDFRYLGSNVRADLFHVLLASKNTLPQNQLPDSVHIVHYPFAPFLFRVRQKMMAALGYGEYTAHHP